MEIKNYLKLTPTEKAKELVKYYISFGLSKTNAKKLALFHIDEIIKRDKKWCELVKKKFGLDMDYSVTSNLLQKTKEKIKAL